MKIQNIYLSTYQLRMVHNTSRNGIVVHIESEDGKKGIGDVAPLPGWSLETLEEAKAQMNQKMEEICSILWSLDSYLINIQKLNLFPSVSFGLESALSMILYPLPKQKILTSALLMGSLEEILEQARIRYKEGFTHAKLKISQLSFSKAQSAIEQLKDLFRLRIDVNRAWNTQDSLEFFAQFPTTTFDYVEEPFKNPLDLHLFPHPLAIDESFPQSLSLQQLHSLPSLKAIIYKPTLQGGLANCIPIYKWTQEHNVDFILSSSFESDLGLSHISALAIRLSLKSPLGLGTYHYLQDHIYPLSIEGPTLSGFF